MYNYELLKAGKESLGKQELGDERNSNASPSLYHFDDNTDQASKSDEPKPI